METKYVAYLFILHYFNWHLTGQSCASSYIVLYLRKIENSRLTTVNEIKSIGKSTEEKGLQLRVKTNHYTLVAVKHWN